MNQDIGNKLKISIQKRVEKISYFCSVENVSPNLSVHELRKTFKRIRALLKLCSASLDEFACVTSKHLISFGKILSPIRESYVNILILDKTAGTNELITERKFKTIRRPFVEKNKDLIKEGFIESGFKDDIRLFINDLERKMNKLDFKQLTVTEVPRVLKTFYEKAYEQFLQIDVKSDSALLHELRKKMKTVWYQMEFVQSMQPKYFKAKASQFKKATELIGEDHDLDVFLNEIINENYKLGETDLKILENQIQHLRELNSKDLFPAIKKCFKEYPEAFNEKMDSLFLS